MHNLLWQHYISINNVCFDVLGWWFDACGPSNLNGIYYQQGQNSNRFNGIKWYYWKGSGYSLRSTTMMIRPADFSGSLWTVTLRLNKVGRKICLTKRQQTTKPKIKILKGAKALNGSIFYIPLGRHLLCTYKHMYTYKHTVCLYVDLFEPNEFLQKIVKNTVLRKECRAHCSYLASQFIGNTPGPSLGYPKSILKYFWGRAVCGISLSQNWSNIFQCTCIWDSWMWQISTLKITMIVVCIDNYHIA